MPPIHHPLRSRPITEVEWLAKLVLQRHKPREASDQQEFVGQMATVSKTTVVDIPLITPRFKFAGDGISEVEWTIGVTIQNGPRCS
jgi:hypothetical protein